MYSIILTNVMCIYIYIYHIMKENNNKHFSLTHCCIRQDIYIYKIQTTARKKKTENYSQGIRRSRQ